jgi:ketosteroid isomerase-like protein
MNAVSAEGLVRTYYEMVDAGDLGLLDLFDAAATYKRPGYGQFAGHEQLHRFYSSDRVIDSGRHTIRALFVDGLHVGVEGTFNGRLRDGRTVQVPFSDFFDLDRDSGALRIKHRRTYFDDQQV